MITADTILYTADSMLWTADGAAIETAITDDQAKQIALVKHDDDEAAILAWLLVA